MFDIEEFVSDVLGKIGGLAADIFGGYIKEAKKDGKVFLDGSKEKIIKWGKLYAAGDLSKEDLTDLIKGQKDLLEIAALTQAGIAATKLEKFRNGVIDIILGGILGVSIQHLHIGGPSRREIPDALEGDYGGYPERKAEPEPPESRENYKIAKSNGENYVKIPVFYGTNRKGSPSRKTNWKFKHKRGKFSLGLCWVSIPKDHQMGRVERPSIFRLEFREDLKKHMILLSVNPLEEIEFLRILKSNISKSKYKEGLIFIHGFKTTFEKAALRTAQLSRDLAIETPMMFSWPSKGKLSKRYYRRDATNIDWTVADLKNYIQQIAVQPGFLKLHIIAHSMGNRGLTQVLREVTDELKQDNRELINEVILAAPDIDTETFKKNIAPKIINKVERITMYVSSHDVALECAQRWHCYPRAGDADEIVITEADGIETIDVSPLKTGFFGHTYFADNPAVLTDLHELLKDSKKPSERNLLEKTTFYGKYWCFKKIKA